MMAAPLGASNKAQRKTKARIKEKQKAAEVVCVCVFVLFFLPFQTAIRHHASLHFVFRHPSVGLVFVHQFRPRPLETPVDTPVGTRPRLVLFVLSCLDFPTAFPVLPGTPALSICWFRKFSK